ncbi:AmpG family muropeptide MFS transporter [Rickettsiales endosymbiont of Stachyamoeba lipophora]|uniref:AmpG family muropeptide MFS transporter n=1 Tax=Rickettsiales endosymbiont of Stachyamoeba lipophora TaxID=2486578 RepID=UPI000F648C04|nr:MFS transporter [Rickettsiales endosymbiont of Stachyamoeba lipophora]AZL15094.1 MFS transporter [Rickettsiales endosymbiont of Stachyamoeba lipophora]
MSLANLFNMFRIYTNPRILAMALLGLTCGLPLVLTGSTLSMWFTEIGVEKSTIGLFAIVTIPYSLKFLWAPIIDFVPLPYLSDALGRRKSWIILSQALLIVSLVLLGFSKPENRLLFTALISIAVAFFSATQDIVVDAYRLELLNKNQQAPGIAAYIVGYRIGMLISGAGALFMAEVIEWSTVYTIISLIIMVSMSIVFFMAEPDVEIKKVFFSSNVFMRRKEKAAMIILRKTIIAPFKDFMQKNHWLLILIFIMFFKLGDAFAGHMANPFYVELGFSKTEIATIVKTYGLLATLLGTTLGGSIIYRYGLAKGVLVCGILQALSNLFYILQNEVGYNTLILALTISVENLVGGMGSAALLAYLSRLCNNPQFTATQYALLSSTASLGRTFLSSSSGFVVDSFGWNSFFIISTILALPALFIFIFINRKKFV